MINDQRIRLSSYIVHRPVLKDVVVISGVQKNFFLLWPKVISMMNHHDPGRPQARMGLIRKFRATNLIARLVQRKRLQGLSKSPMTRMDTMGLP